jgi:hypothetical protein
VEEELAVSFPKDGLQYELKRAFFPERSAFRLCCVTAWTNTGARRQERRRKDEEKTS